MAGKLTLAKVPNDCIYPGDKKFSQNSSTLHCFCDIKDFSLRKISSEMPVPHSLGKYFSTPRDIEVVKQYTDWDTFRALHVKIKY